MSDRPRIGVTGYTVPAGVEGIAAAEWLLGEAATHGWNVLGFQPRTLSDGAGAYDHGALRHVRALADERDVVLEPSAGRVADLAGPGGDGARRALVDGIRAAKVVGGPYIRATYGRHELASSRFNQDVPVREHMDRLVADLREAAVIAEVEGVVLAIENHVDFTGREWAAMLAEVASPRVRAALDTGNGFTVFAPPEDDIEALAPITVMFHLKDMRVVAHGDAGQVPFVPVGCVLGEGHVDIVEAIRLAWSTAERGVELPLVIETGWVRAEPGQDPVQARRDVLIESAKRLRALLQTEGALKGLIAVEREG